MTDYVKAYIDGFANGSEPVFPEPALPPAAQVALNQALAAELAAECGPEAAS